MNHKLDESEDWEDEVSLSEPSDRDALGDEALRQMRIDEYRLESLHREDSQTALLGAITAGLIEMHFRHADALTAVLDNGASSNHENRDLQRAETMYSNTSRQIERNINLMSRLENARQSAKHSGAARRAASRKWGPR